MGESVICPFCGASFKNNDGLKMHIINKEDDVHSYKFWRDGIEFTDTGKVRVECKKCGAGIVFNSIRKDKRVKSDGNIMCLNCEMKRK